MMMPANYSVIAENEMTYVVGGGLIADVLPAIMTASNWKTFNTNMVKIVGNYSMTNFLQATVGEIFGGNFTFGNWGDKLESTYWGKKVTVNDKESKPWSVVNNLLSIVGGLASIYTLGSADAKTLQGDSVLGIQGKL